MEKIIEKLNTAKALVCDGAMGTMLIAKGLPKGACPELWAIENKKTLYSIHRAYIDAGADIIITNTFGANAIKLDKFNLRRKAAEINKRAADIAREAAGDEAYVLGDIGPTGSYLKPAGDIEPQEMFEVFGEQAKALAEAGVNAVILETMSDMEELKQAVMGVKEKTKLPLFASMTFSMTKGKGFRTTSGVTVPQFVDESLLAGCDAIGVNCTLAIADMVGLVSEMRKLTSAFLIAQPNAGMPRLSGDETVYTQPASEFAKYLPDLINAGANIIGGCCGTTPEHIKKIRQAVK